MTMPCMMPRPGAVRSAAAGLLLALTTFGGCDLSDVSDPTKIEEEDVGTALGADLMRRRALLTFYEAEAETAYPSGLLADEFLIENVSQGQDFGLARRFPRGAELDGQAGRLLRAYENRHRIRYEATLAIPHLRLAAPESHRAAHLGQMLAVRGYSTLRLGEDFCPGFPLHELDGYEPVYGPPLTTTQVFERALADLDSAVVLAVDSARILDFARVARGRTLLGLGRFADAAAAVAAVPTGYVFASDSVLISVLNFINTFTGHSVADQKGGNGVDYISAGDPRLETTQFGTGALGTPLYRADKYSTTVGTIVIATGIEARLISAEAALRANPDQPQWLTILNTLRTNGDTSPDGTYQAGTGGVAGLAPLADPGSTAARVDLLFRERALWLFGTGHRLADLRRLIRDYGRSSEAVFPTGSEYGTATSMPFQDPEREKPFSPGVDSCTGL